MESNYFLTRFKNAQENGLNGSGVGTYTQALEEIKEGRKRTHWMWYIFPQVKGLGHSRLSEFYAIRTIGEAIAYLEDDVLNARLREITMAVLTHPTKDVGELFGFPDWLKLGACMTLFDYLCPNDIYSRVLDLFFSGKRHDDTSRFIQKEMARPISLLANGYFTAKSLIEFCLKEGLAPDDYRMPASPFNAKLSNDEEALYKQSLIELSKEDNDLVITLPLISMLKGSDYEKKYLSEFRNQLIAGLLYLAVKSDLSFMIESGLGIRLKYVVGIVGNQMFDAEDFYLTPETLKNMIMNKIVEERGIDMKYRFDVPIEKMLLASKTGI